MGTGFVGITDKRVVIQDKSFVGGKMAITSVPYKNIRSVSMVSNKSMLGKFASTSSIAINTGGGVQQADFRGDEKAALVSDGSPEARHGETCSLVDGEVNRLVGLAKPTSHQFRERRPRGLSTDGRDSLYSPTEG
ncbi:PH domain-containing protein [Arthrobacter sp. NPDC055138]